MFFENYFSWSNLLWCAASFWPASLLFRYSKPVVNRQPSFRRENSSSLQASVNFQRYFLIKFQKNHFSEKNLGNLGRKLLQLAGKFDTFFKMLKTNLENQNNASKWLQNSCLRLKMYSGAHFHGK